MNRHRLGMLMWGRMASCGRVALGLGGIAYEYRRRYILEFTFWR